VTLWRRVVTEKRRIVVLLAVAILINVGLFALVVVPLGNRVRSAELDAANAVTALTAARQDYAAARATVTGKTTADAELHKFYREVLPPDLSGARRITYLRLGQLAQQSNLRMDRSKVDTSTERDSTLGKLTLSVSLSGEYPAVRRFVYALETAPEFLVLENVALAQGDDRARGINVTVQVATYYQAGGNGN
jgi:Tfp pilus assembly protein PilO